MSRVLVTGASGFVGRGILDRLRQESDFRPRASYRTAPSSTMAGVESVLVGGLADDTDWRAAVAGCDAVVHSAARVHMVRDTALDPLALYREINVAGTLALARHAAAAGVRRFVFLSSVKVNGESTPPDRAFRVTDPPAPVDAYGLSKLEAERGLEAIARDTGLDVTIVRPVLVHGPGVKANFDTLMRWVERGLPLPLGAIANRRSIVGLDNLVDLVVTCLVHPAAAGRTFFASDGEDPSTTELLRRVARALGRPSRLLPVPPAILTRVARALGREGLATRLCTSLRVDVSEARAVLGWRPPLTLDEGLARTAAPYIARRTR